MGAIFVVHTLKKMTFCLLATPKEISFLTISDENIFSKTLRARLGVITLPNKGLEQVLCTFYCLLYFFSSCSDLFELTFAS